MANTKITPHVLDSTLISGHSTVTAATNDFVLIQDVSDSNALKKALVSDLAQNEESPTFTGNVAVDGTLTIASTIIHAGDTDTKLDFNQANTMRLITGDNTAWICDASSMVINEDSIDFDFRVESNDSANMLFVDGGNNKVLVEANNTASVTDSASMVAASVFEINGNAGEGSDILRFFAMADGTGNYGLEVSNSGGNAQYDLCINPINGGYVGIGTASPDTHVHISTSDRNIIKFHSSYGTERTYYFRNDSGVLNIGGGTPQDSNDLLNLDVANMRVGIGTKTPAASLHINTDTNSPMLVESTHGDGGYIELQLSDHGGAGSLTGYIGDSQAIVSSGDPGDLAIRAQGDFVVSTGGSTQRFQINSSGSAIFSQNDSTVTIGDAGTNAATIKSSANDELYVGGDDNDGYFRIKTDGNTEVRSPANFWVYINGSSRYGFDAAQLYPATDNYYSLGHSSYRWHTVYRVNESSSSDARKKTTLTALTDNEIKASKLLAKEIGTYKWLKDVSEKGDKAKINVGLTAQKVVEIMNSCSLNALDYQMVQYYEWDAEEAKTGTRLTTDENGNSKVETYEEKPAREAGNEYAVSYEQINQFIAAGFNARLEALEG